jgi:hypothetical protein
VTITNSTIAENVTLVGGEGLRVTNGTVTLTNCTVVRNISYYESFTGGLAVGGGTVLLQNTILALNTTGMESSDCAGPVTSLGNNLIGDPGDPTVCSITLLSNDLEGDPGAGPYTDDETPGNGHFPLLSTSQAINVANPKACPKTDQLGEKRFGICDIGLIDF